jgi:processing peptidase subunit beta
MGGASAHLSTPLAKKSLPNNLANSYMSFNTSYKDTGLFGVYAVTENHAASMHAIQQEWHRLAINTTEAEVFKAKNALKRLTITLDG